MGRYLHLARDPPTHVLGGILEHLVHVNQLHLGLRTYLGEAFGYDRKPLHILVHIGEQRRVYPRSLQQIHPRHQRRYGGAQLVSRLLRQPHPHLVLLGLLRADKCKIDNQHKQHHHSQLHIGIERKPFQQDRVVVVEILFLVATQIDFDHIRATLQMSQLPPQIFLGVSLRKIQVDILIYLAIPIDQNSRYRGIALDDLQDKLHAHLGLVAGQLASRLGPNLHLLALLDREVLDQVVRHIEHPADQQHRYQQKNQLPFLPEIINILHSLKPHYIHVIYIRTGRPAKYYPTAHFAPPYSRARMASTIQRRLRRVYPKETIELRRSRLFTLLSHTRPLS